MISTEQRAALTAAKRLALAIEGVTGVDFGNVYRRGVATPDLAIRFHVRRKRPPHTLSADQLIPPEILGVPTDVVQASYGPHQSPRGLFDPIIPGISIGNLPRQTTGTL